jgi:hypothetical protein
MAYNASGYDNKFLLKWCLEHGLEPSNIIEQGTGITYLRYNKFNIRFIDPLKHMSARLKDLPKMLNLGEIMKGDFPHKFNTPENQNYIGKIPDIKYYGVENKSVKEAAEFREWYAQQLHITAWNFKQEMISYCKDDVKILAKAVLAFRKMFLEDKKLNLDPFRYITLAGVSMAAYKGRFMPDKTIVSNGSNKAISKTSREWFKELNKNTDKIVKREQLVLIKLSELPEFNRHEGKVIINDVRNGKPIEPSDIYIGDKSQFTLDGLDLKNKIAYEFNGCYYHGCRKCCPHAVNKYNATIERENILKAAGYKVETIWGCEWEEQKKNNMTKEERRILEAEAAMEHINIRDAMHGGRTEAFKSYHKCNENEEIGHIDITSQYPSVNSLDEYPVGFKELYDPTVEELRDGSFIGIVKCDVIPPKALYLPVLPQTVQGKMLTSLMDMTDTWCSNELRLALEKGYVISKIHGGYKYKGYTGLMKEYVEYFFKMKTCNSGVLSVADCKEINRFHKEQGLNIHIRSKETCLNPGLKTMSKLCLNSLWGKFGQSNDLDHREYFRDEEYNKFVRKFMDPRNKIKSWDVIGDCVELKYGDASEAQLDNPLVSEITAAFTTASARIRLYRLLNWFHHSQILYCDTDSVIYVYDKTNPLHKKPSNNAADLPPTVSFGNGLSQWSNELAPGEYIEEIVIGGAKSYSFKCNTGRIVMRQKGITQDEANSKLINFEKMRDMVLNLGVEGKDTLKSAERFSFSTNAEKQVITKFISRSIRSTVDQKRSLNGFDTLPFGYVGPLGIANAEPPNTRRQATKKAKKQEQASSSSSIV